MTDARHWIGINAGVLTLVAFVPYARAILRGQTRPNRASWFIWAGICVLTAFMYGLSGAEATLPVAWTFAIVCSVVAVLSIWYGEPGMSRFDRYCIACALLSVIPWIAYRDAPASLYLDIGIDCFALAPTLVKAYRDPASEDRLGWTISAAAQVLNLFAVERWSLRVALYPLYCVVAVGAVAIILHLRKAADVPRISGIRPDPA